MWRSVKRGKGTREQALGPTEGMNHELPHFFRIHTREPFAYDLALHEILEMPELIAVKERFDYTLRIGAMALVTGDIGSGKSTALRYAMGQLHSSEFATFYLTPSSGSILELHHQILASSEFQRLGTL
jgi:general secretion pathway protein A